MEFGSALGFRYIKIESVSSVTVRLAVGGGFSPAIPPNR
jgi:hypothetical protein